MKQAFEKLLKSITRKKYKFGLVLSGGGARGFAHLGVVQALQEKDIYPDIISGVSAGAIAGAFLASGMTPVDIMRLMLDYKFFDYTSIHIPKTGLLSLDKLENNLLSHLPFSEFEELKTPLFVGVSNLNTGEPGYINSGSLSQAIKASASIPVMFSPVEINGNQYVDGGLLDNMPITPIKNLCKQIIGINISPVEEIKKLNNLIEIAGRTFQLSVNANMNLSIKKLDVYIEPPELCDFDILDVTSAQKLFDIGYNYTRSLDINV
ncbi:patatin-like phospholipase family protein [Aquimarina gracilis]|uniref:Patatin-like phospholipase family protein n=1 Tax=Aquimarina gracilis TaxID=874422 RepID=A0ABU5ZVV5_9FLAO|nr:patatin-like phospholipase family protein [Aquimarina gracilis]MEB3345975.1 patatin-like phospholipase family protein [Aquimarina gracilis]